MWAILAYDQYYPRGNNIKGLYVTEEEANKGFVKYVKNLSQWSKPDHMYVEYIPIGDGW